LNRFVENLMQLAVKPPLSPMLAKRVDQLPSEATWIFEPKWDGFRALVFRDGDDILIHSREQKPLNRYFPELLDPIRSQLPKRCVLDGEIVIAGKKGLEFESLQLRLHPAASRVQFLAEQTPASLVFFDLLCEGNRDLRNIPFAQRRRRLESVLSSAKPPLHITPATQNRSIAQDWFQRFEGAGLDGVIAKDPSSIYQPDKRAMLKIKHERDCDCVVAGFRWHRKNPSMVGSLLLGLFDDNGSLHHVGVCSSFSDTARRSLVQILKPYRKNAAANHPWKTSCTNPAPDQPGQSSRWSQGKDLSWEPLRAELVVEVAYDHRQGDRFRHIAQFRRWRNDKRPEACTLDQLEAIVPQELKEIFG